MHTLKVNIIQKKRNCQHRTWRVHCWNYQVESVTVEKLSSMTKSCKYPLMGLDNICQKLSDMVYRKCVFRDLQETTNSTLNLVKY